MSRSNWTKQEMFMVTPRPSFSTPDWLSRRLQISIATVWKLHGNQWQRWPIPRNVVRNACALNAVLRVPHPQQEQYLSCIPCRTDFRWPPTSLVLSYNANGRSSVSSFNIFVTSSSVFPFDETYSKKSFFLVQIPLFSSLLRWLRPLLKFRDSKGPKNLHDTYFHNFKAPTTLPQFVSFCPPEGTTKDECTMLTPLFYTDYRAAEIIVLFARQTATHRR